MLALESKSLDQALEEVEARFLYNLPESELYSPERLFYQIEQAYWYYEDFKADRFTNLPHFTTLRAFAVKVFNHCELLQTRMDQFQELFADYANYKSKIPVCGCILLNRNMTKIVLVCDWSGNSWTFPRGKINENENEFECAIREVFEETGFNARAHTNETDMIVSFQDRKKVQLYIARDVPEDTAFECHTRKEVSKIEFHPIDNIPKRTYHVHPFIPALKRWISKEKQKKSTTGKQGSNSNTGIKPVSILTKGGAVKLLTAQQPSTSSKEKTAKSIKDKTLIKEKEKIEAKAAKIRNLFDARNTETFEINNAKKQGKGWTVDEMFKANAKLTGRDYKDYDGNPHQFGAAHPRYVNYGNASTTASTTQGMPTDQDFHEFSMQSRKVGEKLLRGVSYDEPDEVPTTTKQRTGSLFPKPFKFDSHAILLAIDTALKANPVVME